MIDSCVQCHHIIVIYSMCMKQFVETFAPLEPFSLAMAILVGIFSGLISSLYVYLVGAGPGWVKKTNIPPFFMSFIPASVLFAISPFFPHLIGPGMPAVNMALAGELTLFLLIALAFLKVFARKHSKSNN